VAVGLDGQAEVMAVREPDSHPMGYSIDWLPDQLEHTLDLEVA